MGMNFRGTTARPTAMSVGFSIVISPGEPSLDPPPVTIHLLGTRELTIHLLDFLPGHQKTRRKKKFLAPSASRGPTAAVCSFLSTSK